MRSIKITEKEHLHLLDVAGFNRSVKTTFGPGGCYVSEKTERWALEELCKLRGIDPHPPIGRNRHTRRLVSLE